MRIAIESLKDAPGKTFLHTFAVDAETFDVDRDETTVEGPIDVRLELAYRDGKVVVAGSLRTRVAALCSRCLRTFSYPLEEDFEDEVPVDDDIEVDLTELVREIFLTALPLKPLCQQHCQGLCPNCGEDLNEKQCGCPRDEGDPRMSVLKKLLEE